MIFDSERSDTDSVKCGAPQGSILSLLLFILSVNDMCNVSPLILKILLADDTCVLLSGNNLNTLIDLMKTEPISLTLSDPGYFGQLTIRGWGGGALKPTRQLDLENYLVNLHHIIHVYFTGCFRHVPIGIFLKICDFDHFTAI